MRAPKELPVIAFTLLACGALAASRSLLALSLDGGKQVVDNARVTVWDVIWPSDAHGPIQRMTTDTVTVALTDGPIRVVDLTGTEKTVTRKIGDVRYGLKGDGHREESVGAAVPHDIVIELKDAKVPPLANTSKYPECVSAPRLEESARKRSNRCVGLHVDAGCADADAFSRQGRGRHLP